LSLNDRDIADNAANCDVVRIRLLHVDRTHVYSTHTAGLSNWSRDCMIPSIKSCQNVPPMPTHRAGGSLDLIITKSDQPVDSITVQPPDILLDPACCHGNCRLTCLIQSRLTEIRRWKKLDVDEFRTALLQPELCDAMKRPRSADEFFQRYRDVLQHPADQFAPVTKITIRRQRLDA